jgi:hypothetical protein
MLPMVKDTREATTAHIPIQQRRPLRLQVTMVLLRLTMVPIQGNRLHRQQFRHREPNRLQNKPAGKELRPIFQIANCITRVSGPVEQAEGRIQGNPHDFMQV